MVLRRWILNLSHIRSSEKTIPFALLAILVLSFGIFVTEWGFYFDDWPMVYLIQNNGDIVQYYQGARSFAAWTDIFLKTFLGANPIAWQTTNILVRWGAVISFWWCLKLIWPRADRQVLAVAMLFAVYPVFFQQPIAVTYTHVWLWYALYFLSLCLMVAAVRSPRRFYFLSFLSLLTGAIHILSVEYFWGLELLRPVLLWLVISENPGTWQRRLKKVLLNWSPYLALLSGRAFWRFFGLKLVDDPNPPKMLFALFESPLTAIKDLAQTILRDVLHILLSTWSRAIQPETILINSISSLASWGLVILVAILVGLYLAHFRGSESSDPGSSFSWERQAMIVGVYALLVGMIPAWVAGRQVHVGMYSDRFALPAMVGASLVICGVLLSLISKWSHKAIIFAILIGLSAGVHLRVGNDYRKDWINQRNFYWQLYWRAPAIKPDTSIITEGGLFKYVTKYSISTALNVLYLVPEGTTDLPYWSFELDDLSEGGFGSRELLAGMDLHFPGGLLSYTAPSRNSILIDYLRGRNHCLWVLSPTDADYPNLHYYTSLTLELSNLDQILPDTSNSTLPDRNIFGPEPEHTWCYYFQKADLARQFGKWETVSSLGNQALSLGYGPDESYEWLPFIEGYIHVRNWEMAKILTIGSYENDSNLERSLCAVWSRSIKDMSLTPDEQQTVTSVTSELGCTSP